MPQTKPKPAAAPAQPIKPEPPKPTARELRRADTERQFGALQEFIRTFENIGITRFDDVKTFVRIVDRDGGSTTPVEDFIVSLVHQYQAKDDDGEGLTLEDIGWQMEQSLTDDDTLERAIKDARVLASRYPLKDATKPEITELKPEVLELISAKLAKMESTLRSFLEN